MNNKIIYWTFFMKIIEEKYIGLFCGIFLFVSSIFGENNISLDKYFVIWDNMD